MTQVQSPREYLEVLKKKNREFYNDPRGRGALRDLQQTFPHPWLYVAELLQNAVDEGARHIHLRIEPEGLVFEHDGEPFTEGDVEALCQRGVSGKGPGTVGFMGVGFKAVFRSFQRVQVSSGPWHFALTVRVVKGREFGDLQREWLGAVLPEWDERATHPSTEMTCRFLLSERLEELEPISKDIERVFGEDRSLLALLARRGVEEIDWNGERWILARQEAPVEDSAGHQVLLEAMDADGKQVFSWILISTTYKPSRAAVRRFLEHRQISPSEDEKAAVYAEAEKPRQVELFCALDENKLPLCPDRGQAFSLLPTGVTLPIGLHVQADWLLVISRRELMQIEGNEWHQEILHQIPMLLRYYILWVTQQESHASEYLAKRLRALPGDPQTGNDSDSWFASNEFSEAVRKQFQGLAFLPTFGRDGRIQEFLCATEGRILPEPLGRVFEAEQEQLADLFGPHVVSATCLGSRATRFFSRLGLLRELSAQELKTIWEDGGLATWLGCFPNTEQPQKLDRLFDALYRLDSKPDWKSAELPCLPTEAGTLTSRKRAVRLPPDWDQFRQVEGFNEAVEPFAGSRNLIFAWRFQRFFQRSQSGARNFISCVEEASSENLVSRWWASLPEVPTEDQLALIVKFTCWIRANQAQRRGLIVKALCQTGGNQQVLLSVQDALLADPYATPFRRRQYPSFPTIADVYWQKDPTVNPTEWRTFWESGPAPKGRFSLELESRPIELDEVRALLGGVTPDSRFVLGRIKWHGLEMRNGKYWSLEGKLPESVQSLLEGPSIDRDVSRGLAEWMSEEPGLLRVHAKLLVGYIGGHGNVPNEKQSLKAAGWVHDLDTYRWIYDHAGLGPFRPRDILARADLARPHAPIAEIPEVLVAALEEAGIRFGVALPDAPLAERLRMQGPTAEPTVLRDLVEKAIEEARQDEDKTVFLRKAIEETNLFPFPADKTPIDGSHRVSHGRVIRAPRGRSTLGDWLVPVEEFQEGSPERMLLETVAQFHPVPPTATGKQVLGFLSWVWDRCPDAERVRRVLPRAYHFVKEDLAGDQEFRDRWVKCVHNARVFDGQKREWARISGGTVYLDDLKSLYVSESLAGLQIATPGHLGETHEDQVATARILNLPLLSSRIQVDVSPSGRVELPEHWQQGFLQVQKWLMEQLARSGVDLEEDVPEGAANGGRGVLSLSRWDAITVHVSDRNKVVRISSSKACWYSETIAVVGEPEDFADELCDVLLEQWRLVRRRDIWRLASRLTSRLIKLDRMTEEQNPQEASKSTESEKTKTGTQPGLGSLIKPLSVEFSSDENIRKTGKPEEGASDIEEKTCEENDRKESVTGRGHTAEDREGMIQALLRRKSEAESQLNALSAICLLPNQELSKMSYPEKSGELRSDIPYRAAALKYEREQGRYPQSKSSTEAGHDLDSYTHPEGHPDRKLVRRVEVKGKGVPWTGAEIVELSHRQFKDALIRVVGEEVPLAPDFDYWLYVVEIQEAGVLKVLPIKNPAKFAGHFELRGGTWRHLVEKIDES